VRSRQRYPETAVGAIILNKKGQMLLVRSHKWGDRYTVAGGHVEVGETLVGALKREIKEEVGLRVREVEFLMVQEAIFSKEFWEKRHFIFFDFVCRCSNERAKVDGKEIQGHMWVEPKRAARLKRDRFTMKMVRKYLSTRSATQSASFGS
jgi:nucleoside triphosphatase